MEYVSVAGPCPWVLLREIQADSDRADHAHSRAAVTVSVPVPPAAGTAEPPPVTETPHLTIEGPATVLTSAELLQAVMVASAARPAAIRVKGACAGQCME